MPDKKLIFQVRTIFLRSKEMIVVLSLFMFSIVAAMIWLMAGNVSALYDDAALGALDVPLKFSLASFVVFSFLSFEMSYKLRRYKLDECMDTVTHAKRKIFLAQGIVFAVVIFAFFIVFNIFSLISICLSAIKFAFLYVLYFSKFANLVYFPSQARSTVPVEPALCFAIITSAIFFFSESSL